MYIRIFTLILLLLSGSSVLATDTPQQFQTIPSEIQKDVVTDSIVVADVSLTDVVWEEIGNDIKGTFKLTSYRGQQSDIAYGVVLEGADGTLVSAMRLGAVDRLRERETVTIPFTFTVPSTINGTFDIRIVVETAHGLPLGSSQLLNKKITGVDSPFTCTITPADISCDTTTSRELTILVTDSLFTDKPLRVFRNSISPATPLSLPFAGTGLAGLAYVHVSDGDTYRTYRTHIAGAFGKIQNIMVEGTETDNLKITATYSAQSIQNLSASYTLIDSAGGACASGTLTTNGLVASGETVSTCDTGFIILTLKDKNGNVLDTVDQEFSIVPYEETARPDLQYRFISILAPLSGWYILVTLLVVVLGILLLLYLYMRNRAQKGEPSGLEVTLLLIAICGLTLPNTSHALTLVTQTWGPDGCGACEIGFYAYSTISSNKASYLPGETITLTAYHDIGTDIGLNGGDRGTISVAFPPSPNTFDIDVGSTGGYPAYGYQVVFSGGRTPSDSVSFTIPSNMSPGGHFISQRPLLSQQNSTGRTYSSDFAIGRINFTIASPPPPSIWVSF